MEKQTFLYTSKSERSGYDLLHAQKPRRAFVSDRLHAFLARVGKSEKVLHYNRCEHCVCVCVCVCVCKVVISSETAKGKALKDAEKLKLFCSPTIPLLYMLTRCIVSVLLPFCLKESVISA